MAIPTSLAVWGGLRDRSILSRKWGGLDGGLCRQNLAPTKTRSKQARQRTVLSFRVDNGKLKATSRPLPKLRPGWALVRVRLAGICNTDVEILRGYHGFKGTPGHEFVGEVADIRGVSTEDKRKWIGQRVCGEVNVSWSAHGFKVCDLCRRVLKTHWARGTVRGIL